MIRKIIIYAIIILLIPCYSYSAVPKVSDLYPAYKVYDAVNKVWTVPAKVIAKSSTAIATDSVALGLTKSIAGGIVTSLAIAGVGYAGNKLIDYLLSQSPPMYYAEDGILKQDIETRVPPAVNDLAVAEHMINTVAYTYGLQNVIYEGVCYASAGSCNRPSGYTFMTTDNGFYSSGCQFPIKIYQMWTGYAPNQKIHIFGEYYASENCFLMAYLPTPVTYTEVQNQVDTAIDNAIDESAPVVDVVNEAIDKAADLVNNGEGISAKSPSVAYYIENYLNSAIPESAANALNDKLSNANASNTTADKAVSEGTSQATIMSAITNALRSFFGTDINAPVDPAIETPSKRSLTAILETFYNSMSSLPIISTLQGIAVTASGSSTLCVNLPANYGGTRCWNAAGNQADFNMIGSALLAVVSILSVMYIFRGN